jgi:hypothetical protein
MRLLTAFAALVLIGCGSSTPEKTAAKAAEAPAPPPVVDDTAKLPEPHRTSAKVVPNNLLGIKALPGGTIGDYEEKGRKYQLFIIETPTPQDAAIHLLDIKAVLKDPTYVASFGGYFGNDGTSDIFAFAKDKYLTGVVGLPQARADAIARQLAAQLK